MNQDDRKNQVRSFWNEKPCGSTSAKSPKLSIDYFREIEDHRYKLEPEIFSFAQFTRFHGQKVLEVGVGAGTDFLQWVRAGAEAYGMDFTEEGVEHTKRRLDLFGLSAMELKVADAEDIPYPSNFADLVYSWGVIHHTPNTIKALEEIIRVTRIGGLIKLMIYNRHSLVAYYKYLLFGPLRGRPFRSLSDIMYHHQESIGTKAYTFKEIRGILSMYPVEIREIKARVTSYDLLWDKPLVFRGVAYILASILGLAKCGFFMTVELKKTGDLNTAQ